MCQCEALIHKLDESPSNRVESFCFLDCVCVKKKTFEGFDLRLPGLVGKHRTIAKESQELSKGSGHVLTLHWPHVNKGLASPESLSHNEGMKTRPPDLENVNDNLPVEHELGIVIAWAKQAGYVNVAAAVTRALIELEAGRKLAEMEARRK